MSSGGRNPRSAAAGRAINTSVKTQKNYETNCGQHGQQLSTDKCIPEKKITTAFSIGSMQRILSSFSWEKMELVQSIGFGILLRLFPQTKFPRQLALWVLSNMKSTNGELELSTGSKRLLNDCDVELVLGIPRKNRTIQTDLQISEKDVAKIRNILMLNEDEDVSLDRIEGILTREYAEKMSTKEQDAFKVAFAVCADAYFLGPRGSNAKINKDMYKNLANPEMIGDFNWCGYVLKCLVQSAKQVQQSLSYGNKTVTLDGYLLFIVVWYLDNVNFGYLTPSKNMLPRVKDYPNRVIKTLEKEDRDYVTQGGMVVYGRNELLREDNLPYANKGKFREKEKTNNDKENIANHDTYREFVIKELICKLDRWANQVNEVTSETHSALLKCFERMNDQCDYSTNRRHVFEQGKESGIKTVEASGQSTHDSNQMEAKTEKIPDTGGIQESNENLCKILAETKEELDHSDPNNMVEAKALQLCLRKLSTRIVARQYCSYDQTKKTDQSEDQYSLSSQDETDYGKFSLSNEVQAFNDDNYKEVEQEVISKLNELGLSIQDYESEIEGSEEMNENAQEELECPTPLLKVTPTSKQRILCNGESIVKYSDGNTIVMKDMGVIIQYINSKSKFGVSPFAIGMTHRDVPLENKIAMQMAMGQASYEDMTSTWFMHMWPNKIQIDGKVMHGMFQGKTDFVQNAIDALVRLYQQMDTEMYSRWNEKRWRHFLTTDFAIWALQPGRGQPTTAVQERLFGEHIPYSIKECRLVMVPLLVHWHWCLYVWDFERHKLVVLDPKGNHLGKEELEQKHRKTVDLMDSGMKDCLENFFNENKNREIKWDTEYIESNGGEVDSTDTGLYTMFYARHFDGKFMTRILTKEATQMQRISMMCQLLSMEGNIGNPPPCIREAMYHYY